MGQLYEGRWQTDVPKSAKADGGKFLRPNSQYRNWVTADGAAGPSGDGGFEAEAGRYHIYYSLACPWAHRTLIIRRLKGLEAMVSASGVDADMMDEGWVFSAENPDPLFGKARLYEVYQQADAAYTGRVTVPVLWDKTRETIVSNESSEIIRMLNSAFDSIGADASVDFYPEPLRAEIDDINSVVYDTVNNGVYKSGFARSQAAYEGAVTALFTTLDRLEDRLARHRYLVGDRITEADWRLFTTLVRFDAVYVGHFKCNIRRIDDYPNLSNYLRDLYQMPGIAETVDIDFIKRHYYFSHRSINPLGIVPVGPALDFTRPHDRAALKAA